MSVENVMKLIQDNEVRFVDLRFTDTRGKEQHVGLPISAFEEDHFESGHPSTARRLRVGRVSRLLT